MLALTEGSQQAALERVANGRGRYGEAPDVYGTSRVLRGGGWFDERWSSRGSVRPRSHPTLRPRSHPTFRIDDVGFRLGRSVVR